MRLSQTWNLIRQMGIAWVFTRADYALRRKLGWVARRMPARPWTAYNLSQLVPDLSADAVFERIRDSSESFFIHPGLRIRYQKHLGQLLSAEAKAEVVAEARAAREGKLRFFSADLQALGWPPNWHRHLLTGDEWPIRHWCELPEMPQSDIKWLWEPGRFGVTYSLVRAYWITGDESHADTFWQLVDSWRATNPPNQGCHWLCGQECAIRVLAWCFGLFGFLDASATTAERALQLVEMLAAHGERIEGNLAYALSQKNNHAINEALALWTLGILFPFLPRAKAWEARGRDLLEREAQRQIYVDGAYVQHSLNYHRLVLQSFAWALRLSELHSIPFTDKLHERYVKAAWFLFQLTDPISGAAPNYGSNDGASLWRLDACEFQDQRSALVAAFWVGKHCRVFPSGPWDETLLWLGGEEALSALPEPKPVVDFEAKQGGYYTLRGQETWGCIRCCEYRDRPAQADMLHVDLWWRGHNFLADPGTYAYAAPPPWNNGLAGTGVHNTISIDGHDQMQRGPRFVWFYWAKGKVLRHESMLNGRLKLFEGEHDGFLRLGVLHRRTLALIDESHWLIVDDLLGENEHELSSAWLYPEASLALEANKSYRVSTAPGDIYVSHRCLSHTSVEHGPQVEMICGDQSSTRGWFSPCYGKKESSPMVVIKQRCQLPVRLLTVIALGTQSSTKLLTEAIDGLSRACDSGIPASASLSAQIALMSMHCGAPRAVEAV